jgi:hypothetical protein
MSEEPHPDFHIEIASELSKCDALISECEEYLDDAERQPLSPSLAKLNPMKNWNDKRRDERLSLMSDKLALGVAMTESKLRDLIAVGSTKKEKLRGQCYELKTEIEKCSEYIEDMSTSMEELAERVRGVINVITSETEELKNMVAFNKEVVKQNETVEFYREFGRWGDRDTGRYRGKARVNSRLAAERGATAADNDEHHKLYLARLVLLRGSRDKLMAGLSMLLEKREGFNTVAEALSDNVQVMSSMGGVMAPHSSSSGSVAATTSGGSSGGGGDSPSKGAATTTTSSGNDSEGEGEGEGEGSLLEETLQSLLSAQADIPNFEGDALLNHFYACSTTASASCDRLLELKKDIMEATGRLQLLVETREKIIEVNTANLSQQQQEEDEGAGAASASPTASAPTRSP